MRISIIAAFLLCWQTLFSEPLKDFDQFIEQARAHYNVPGVAVVVVKGNDIIFLQGFGQRDIDQPGQVDENTIFQLASVSKTFAAAGLGVQVDLKKLKWDDEVIEHLPGFALKEPYPTRFATSRDLLAHRTGLPAFGGDLLGKLGYTSEEILHRIRFIDPASSFRNKAFYSNVGFFAAGELLANIAQRPWAETIKTTLMDPLKMYRSGFVEKLADPNVASGHARIDGKSQLIPLDKSMTFLSAGGVTSTARDMANWMIMHLNEGTFEGKQILMPETVKEIFAPSMVTEVGFSELPPINDNSSLTYAMGWVNYNCNGKVIVEKGGAYDGIRTVVTLIPELKVGITILANLNLTVLPEVIRARFLKDYVGPSKGTERETFDELDKKLSGLVNKPPLPANAIPRSHSLAHYTGTFGNELYGSFLVSQKGDTLVINAGPARLEGKLTHWSNNTFLLHWPFHNSGYELITFTFGPEGRAISIQTETLGTFEDRGR